MIKTRIARELPFVPIAKTIVAMKDARAGKTKSFDSMEALMADLNADD